MAQDQKDLSGRDQLTTSFIAVVIRLGVLALLLYWSWVLVPPLYFNWYLERSTDSCALSGFPVDVISTRRTSSISSRSDYDFELADRHWTSDVAGTGAG